MEDLNLFRRGIIQHSFRDKQYPTTWEIALDSETYKRTVVLDRILIGSFAYQNFNITTEDNSYETSSSKLESALKDKEVGIIAFFCEDKAPAHFLKPEIMNDVKPEDLKEIEGIIKKREQKREEKKQLPEGQRRAKDQFEEVDKNYLMHTYGNLLCMDESERRNFIQSFPETFGPNYAAEVYTHLPWLMPKNFLTAALGGILLLDTLGDNEKLERYLNNLKDYLETNTDYSYPLMMGLHKKVMESMELQSQLELE